MRYNYETERENIFTDEGQREFLKVRDMANKLLEEAGSFKISKGRSGRSHTIESYVDRLVELGEIREVTGPGPKVPGQDRVFVRA